MERCILIRIYAIALSFRKKLAWKAERRERWKWRSSTRSDEALKAVTWNEIMKWKKLATYGCEVSTLSFGHFLGAWEYLWRLSVPPVRRLVTCLLPRETEKRFFVAHFSARVLDHRPFADVQPRGALLSCSALPCAVVRPGACRSARACSS